MFLSPGQNEERIVDYWGSDRGSEMIPGLLFITILLYSSSAERDGLFGIGIDRYNKKICRDERKSTIKRGKV